LRPVGREVLRVLVVAIDIGGTFTDLLGFDEAEGAFIQAKSLTTPGELTQGIIDCLRKSGLEASAIDELIHGSTIAINTLIERKGAKTGLVVTRGTRDVYIIGRGNRPEAYNLLFHKHRPLVPRRLTREVDERVLASGEVHAPLKRASVKEACEALKADGVEAVAVCFLHAYVNPEHERIAGEIVRKALPDAYVSLSHDILREYREFERMSTTVVNAYIGPKVGGYVKSLKSSLGAIGFSGDLSIMRSNGGVMTPEVATERPVAMMESGPVGGIIASARVGVKLGHPNVISFDMGGTTAKASLVRAGEPTLAPGYYVGGYASGHPVMLPMIDVVEVGAGGGSIAWIDEVGALKVGPQSAGADPGPICYGKGQEITVTDANLFLGRLVPDHFLGRTMTLQTEALAEPFRRLAGRLGLDPVELAEGVLAVANTTMERAIKVISVERGFDPREFTLLAFGGAGGLHAAALAASLRMAVALVPRGPGVLSALGMASADALRDLSESVLAPLERMPRTARRAAFARMRTQGRRQLADEGYAKQSIEFEESLDLRYRGQSFEIRVREGRNPAEAFQRSHERLYGHRLEDREIELVQLRLRAIVRRPLPAPRKARTRKLPADAVIGERRAWFETRSGAPRQARARVIDREHLAPGHHFDGPALVEEYSGTTLVPPRWSARVSAGGHLLLMPR
jgi:N-methylhydantoinase A